MTASDRDLTIRATIVAAAVVVGAIGVWWPVSTLLAALAALAVGDRVVRLRGRGRLDALLVGVGGLIVSLILLGLLLDVVPGGLTRLSWSIGLGLIGLTALVECRRRPGGQSFTRHGPRKAGAAVWAVATGGLTVLAVVISVTSANDGESPPLQMSVRDIGSTHADVVVRGGSSVGTYELIAGTGAARRVVRRPFRIGAGESIVTTVALGPGTRLPVYLDSTSPRSTVRFVILDNTGR